MTTTPDTNHYSASEARADSEAERLAAIYDYCHVCGHDLTPDAQICIACNRKVHPHCGVEDSTSIACNECLQDGEEDDPERKQYFRIVATRGENKYPLAQGNMTRQHAEALRDVYNGIYASDPDQYRGFRAEVEEDEPDSEIDS